MVSTAQELHLFTELVGAEHVRTADAGDSVGGVVPSLVVAPADELEVASVLSAARARGLANKLEQAYLRLEKPGCCHRAPG